MNRRLVLSVLGLCLVLGFSALGRWQLGREQAKREQLAEAAAALAAAPRPLAAQAAEGSDVVRVAGQGQFVAAPRLFLDNQRREAAVGVRLYCLFAPEGGTSLLVDMGWLPLAPDRTLPGAVCPRGEHAVAGLLVPPPAVGLRLGPGLVADADGRSWLATRLEPAQVQSAWKLSSPLSTRVLRLDPALPLGHARDLALLANTLPPEKHRGYAVQWFGLALATFVILVVLNLRKRP